jgi:hypothetical protein
MSLTRPQEVEAVQRAVNQGIDAHLEACYCPSRGDSYLPGERRLKSGQLITRTLECRVSVESLPVLIRRLFDLYRDTSASDEVKDAGEDLASNMLETLDIGDDGQYRKENPAT